MGSRTRFFAFVTLVSAIAAGAPRTAVAAQPPQSLDPAAINRFLDATVREKHLVGLSVAIVREGKPILTRGYGQRSLEDHRPVVPETLFAIGSVTKQFTCACVLLLAEEGKLSVNDPVAKYYPRLTRASDITLLDLMNHVSGYADYYPLDFVDLRMQKPIDPDELLRQYAGGPLDFEPGTKYSYSNTGFILLGRVVEKVSGKSFSQFLAERILQPLGMDHTLFEPDPKDPRLARGYVTFALGEPESELPEAPGWIGAAGGIFSTPGDLMKWDLALISGQVLKPESYEIMTRNRLLKDGRHTGYACGLGLDSPGGRDVLQHNGAVSGFNAFNAMIPGTRSAVAVCINLGSGAVPIGRELLNLLVKVPEAVPDIAGLPAREAAKALFVQYQQGAVNRSQFTPEFNAFLTDEKLAGAAQRLKDFPAPESATLLSRRERGGMEVTVTELKFDSGRNLRTLMYRHPGGKVAQFFVLQE